MAEFTLIEKSKYYEFIQSLKNSFNISLGIFLFILFFQPFDISHFDSNNQLIFIAGISGIIFIFISIFDIFVPKMFPKIFYAEVVSISAELVSHGIFIVLSTVANVFYIRYVGKVEMSFFLVFKITLICMVPVVILKILQDRKTLLEQLNYFMHKKEISDEQSNELKDNDDISETIFSDNKSEKLELQLSNLILISSADNYVNIIYRENDVITKKMIRNTLKNLEEQLKQYPDIIRCHRTCIVNKKYIQKLSQNYKGYRLIIHDYEAEVPVSRQYLLKVKEALGLA